MSYIGNEPIVSATRTITEVTATAGQTVFTANGGYTVGYIDVFVNGAQLQTVDFTATNGTTITLTEAAQVGDVLKLVAWGTFSTSTAMANVNPSYTGTLTGDTGVVNIGSGQVYKDASGNVGIGTSSPTVRLQLEKASNCTAFVRTTSGATTALYSDSSTGWVYTQSNHPLILGTNDAERMRIASNGNVFVGGTSQNTASGLVYSKTNAKAWARFNGSALTVTASHNISSVTRLFTGGYTFNFASALTDSNWAGVSSCSDTSSAFGAITWVNGWSTTSGNTFSANESGLSYYNDTGMQIIVFGN